MNKEKHGFCVQIKVFEDQEQTNEFLKTIPSRDLISVTDNGDRYLVSYLVSAIDLEAGIAR